MDFVLFLLATAILFIRPTDFVPGLQVNLYLFAIVPCILLSWHKVAPQLTMAALREQPALIFGIGILVVSIISNAVHGNIQAGFDFVLEFGKILIFYLLMQAQLDSRSRLRLYVGCLVGIMLVPTLLAVLNYHGYIHLEAFQNVKDLDSTGGSVEEVVTEINRLGATGNFADPNDVCELVNCAIIFSLYRLLDRVGGCTRFLWLGPIALLGHALVLTQSRGGLLGLVVGLTVLFQSRFGTRKTLMAAGLALPLIVVYAAGRQTSLNVKEGSAQGRIQLWDDAFQMLRGSPVIGGGLLEFAKKNGHVAHNAFLQTCAEFGLLGGALLFGQYFYCLKNLRELGATGVNLPDLEMRRLQPFVLGSVASFATSEMSITNPFTLIMYSMLGLATAFIRLADPSPPLPDVALNRSLVGRIILFFGLFLLTLFVFVRLNLAYG